MSSWGAIQPRVSAGAVAGALAGVIITELARRGVVIDANESSDLTLLIMAGVAYFWPASEDEKIAKLAKDATITALVQPPPGDKSNAQTPAS
jgi:hypothetical protein